MSDFECEVPGNQPDPSLYRLVEKFLLSDLGSGIFSAAAELVKLSRAPRWHGLDNGRRPIQAGDILSLGGKNYMFSLASGRQLKDCRYRLRKLEKPIL